MTAIDDASAGKFDAALTHALIAIDATSKRIFPELSARGNVHTRYVRCLRNYYWLVEPMVGAGINLVDTRFENVRLTHGPAPDFAEIVYQIFRNPTLHGDEPSPKFSVVPTSGGWLSRWVIADGELHVPDRLLWALLAVAVFARPNADQRSTGAYWLSPWR